MAGLEDSRGSLPHYHGYRDPLRTRFGRDWGAGMESYELLELLLFRAIPRRDTKPLAKALLTRFGSLTEVLAAPPHLLMEFDGIGEKVVQELKLVKAVAERFGRERLRERPVLSSWSALLDYCRTFAAFEEVGVSTSLEVRALETSLICSRVWLHLRLA